MPVNAVYEQVRMNYSFNKRDEEQVPDERTLVLIIIFNIVFASLFYYFGLRDKNDNQRDNNNRGNNNNGFSLYVRNEDILPSYQDALDTSLLDNNNNNNTSHNINNSDDDDDVELPDYTPLNNEFSEAELPTYQDAVDCNNVCS